LAVRATFVTMAFCFPSAAPIIIKASPMKQAIIKALYCSQINRITAATNRTNPIQNNGLCILPLFYNYDVSVVFKVFA